MPGTVPASSDHDRGAAWAVAYVSYRSVTGRGGGALVTLSGAKSLAPSTPAWRPNKLESREGRKKRLGLGQGFFKPTSRLAKLTSPERGQCYETMTRHRGVSPVTPMSRDARYLEVAGPQWRRSFRLDLRISSPR